MKSKLMWFTVMTLFAALAIPVRLPAQEQTGEEHRAKHHRYRFVDIGTFGGPASYLTEPGFGRGELVLNSRGKVAGKSETSTPDKGSGNCPPICFATKVFRWERGVLTPLDGLSTVINNSDVGSINSRGWIAGNSATGDIDPITGGQMIRGVLWKENKPIDLGTLGGLESTAAYVNDGGEVVGFSTIDTIPDPFSFLGGSIHPFIWKDGVMRDLGTLGTGTDALPGVSCANDSHQVTGFSFIDSTPNPETGVPTEHPFLWENGKMTDLGTLGGTLTAFDAAQCVNNRGQVAGVSTLHGDKIIHPFLWDHGVLTDLGTLGGDVTITTWLNDAGEVVGGTTTAGEAAFHATLWRDGAITDLGTLEGDCGGTVPQTDTGRRGEYPKARVRTVGKELGKLSTWQASAPIRRFSLAHAVNSKGQIVGESASCDGITLRAFLWDKGEIVDLNTLIPANSSLQLAVAANINNRGEIAGTGTPPGCADYLECGHAFLLIPCDDDHADEEGCQDEGGGTAGETQNHATPGTQTSTDVNHGSLTPEALAARRARFARPYHFPGLGVPRF